MAQPGSVPPPQYPGAAPYPPKPSFPVAAIVAIVLVAVFIVIGLLAAIAVPSFLNARYKSQQSACLDNLRILEGGMEQYKMDNNASAPSSISDLVPNYVKAVPV